jgi:hypothetical protein
VARSSARRRQGWEFAGELLDPAPGFDAGQVAAGMYPWIMVGDGSGTYAEIYRPQSAGRRVGGNHSPATMPQIFLQRIGGP